MQTNHYSAPAISRSRPSYGPLIFGSLFLWGGIAGILHDTTTMGLGPSLTIALSVSGFYAFVVTMMPRFSDRETADPEAIPQTVQPQPVQPTTEQQPTEQQSTGQMTEQDGTVELDQMGEMSEIHKTQQQEALESQDDPWDAEQGWASDIRW